MPKRTDIHSILLIGSGPIVIGQACEFDYSGTQACKALKEEGYRVILINSNPATIMTDPGFADRTYVEPITAEVLEKHHRGREARRAPADRRRSDRAQHGHRAGRARHPRTIRRRAHRRQVRRRSRRPRTATSFKAAMQRIGLDVPRSGCAHSPRRRRRHPRGDRLAGDHPTVAHARRHRRRTSPPRWRSSATRSPGASTQSPINEVLIEESIAGWKEFELEVMRDGKRQRRHRLLDREPRPHGRAHRRLHHRGAGADADGQRVPDHARRRSRASFARSAWTPAGSNIQFAVHPDNGRMVVIEMNPRVSRSSALASKATGFPIAKIAAKLAVGYTLDEIPNDITRETPACFEPTIDYVVTKIPRFTFEKFAAARDVARPADEVGRRGHGHRPHLQGVAAEGHPLAGDRLLRLRRQGPRAAPRERRAGGAARRAQRPPAVVPGRGLSRQGSASSGSTSCRSIDPWFLENIRQIVAFEEASAAARHRGRSPDRRRPCGRPRSWASPTSGWRSSRGTTEEAVRQARLRSRRRAGLQDGRHLRRRVRGVHALPVLHLRRGGRVRRSRRARRS